MRFFFNIYLSFFLWTTFQCFASIIECQHLHEILPLIDDDTLVVFNINNVLTVSCQDAGSTPWAEEEIARIMENNKVSKLQATNLFIPFWHEILIASDVELFDPDAEAVVRYLQNKGIKVMALTNRYIEMGYPTHRNLRSVGIDFAKNPPWKEDCPIQGLSSPAKFIEGILFNGLINFKGDSLAAFLKQIGYKPSRLIYIEDKPKHLAQVEQTIRALNIPFIGIHFGALELQRASYRPELAKLQVKFHQDLLDDESARKLIYERRGMSIPQNSLETPLVPSSFKCIQSIAEVSENLIPNTLIITELDHVLWHTQGSIGTRSFFDLLIQKYSSLGNSQENSYSLAARTIEKIHRRAQVRLMDETSVTFFNELASKECFSLAISYRPLSLLQRTVEQADTLGLNFNYPFAVEHPFQPRNIICGSHQEGGFNELSQRLLQLSFKPSQILGISSAIPDLIKLQEIASMQKIPFQGYLFYPALENTIVLDDQVLLLQLELLDRLLTNNEADFLLSG